MEQLSSIWESIRTALGRMTATQKLLIGSLAVIGLMTLMLVSQYSSSPGRVTIMPSAPAEVQQGAVTHLVSKGIDAELDPAGEVTVPRAARQSAMSVLAQAQMLPGDASMMFETLIERQSWQNSRSMNQQQFMIALQNELAFAISGFSGISDAAVIIDDPEPSGLGRAVRPASASVAVTAQGPGGLDQASVDAIAHLVASSRARLDVGRVRVIDRTSNTQWGATDPTRMRANSYLEHKAAFEKRVSEQLYAQLRYIPNVIISVTASVDVTQVESQFNRFLPDKDGSLLNQIAKETSNSVTERSATTAGEPGLRSNTTADINTPGSGTSGAPSLETEDSERAFQHFPGTEQRRVVDPRGVPTYMAATISVPEEYIADLVRMSTPAPDAGVDADPAPAAVDPADVEAKFAEVRRDIVRGVFPHLRTPSTPESPSTDFLDQTVHVSMVPAGFATASILPTSQAGSVGLGGGGLWALGGGMIDTIVVAVLAMAALGMMITVVRRSTKKLDLPTPEDLVGIPPALETMSEVVGEVDESIQAMEAAEVDDFAVEQDQILQQVTELLKQNPEGSAKLLSRWIASDE